MELNFLPDKDVRLDSEEDVAVDEETVGTAHSGDDLEGTVGFYCEVDHDDHPDGEKEHGQSPHESGQLPTRPE